MSPRRALVSLMATIGMGLPSAAIAGSVTVGSAVGSHFTDIDSAIASATPGEELTIYLEAGNWPAPTISRSGTTRFMAASPADAPRMSGIRVSHPDADVYIDRISIGEEGVQLSQGELSLSSLSIESSSPIKSNAAIEVASGASLTADNVLVSEWTIGDAPIVLQPGSTATFDTVGVFNSMGMRAGAIWSQGATLSATTFYAIDTTSSAGAGALALSGGSTTLIDCDFDTVSGALGGGIHMGNDAILSARDIDFIDNSSTFGAAIRMDSGTLELVRSYARGGMAEQGGVLWMADGTAAIRNADWSDNQASKAGGSIYQADGNLNVVFATWTASTSNRGAGLYARGGSSTLSGVLLANLDGAAMVVDGSGSADFSDGFVWNVGATTPIEGAVSYSVNEVYRDPAFMSAPLGDYALRLDSPALDMGVHGKMDRDGTPSDAGMYGGPDAWELADMDGDGFVHGRDCNDYDARVNESAVDVYYDGVDANCDGASDFDQDGDGFDASAFGGADCDDTKASVNPDASESNGDGLDADCDGFDYVDADLDGWPSDLDCDDHASDVYPGAEDAWYDGVDADCAGNDDFDQDGDGYPSSEMGGEDCNDADPSQNPDRMDTPDDGIDQDCDGRDAISQPDAQDEVTTLSPATDSDDEESGSAMLTSQSKGGCSTAAGSTGGAWGLMLLGVLGLVGRRR